MVGGGSESEGGAKPGCRKGPSSCGPGGKGSAAGRKAADSTEYSFLPREAGKYVLKAEARSPGGETLAEKTLVVEVAGYEVAVTVLGPAGPRPQEWVQGQGLRTVEKDTFLRDEHVRMKAEVKDADAPKDIGGVDSGAGDVPGVFGHRAGGDSVRHRRRNGIGPGGGAGHGGPSSGRGFRLFPRDGAAPRAEGSSPEGGRQGGPRAREGERENHPLRFRGRGQAPLYLPVGRSGYRVGDIHTFIPDRPGTFRFTLLVLDSAGRQVTVNRDVEVKPFTVAISGIPQRAILGKRSPAGWTTLSPLRDRR